MITLLSPAKTLDFDTEHENLPHTEPMHTEKSQQLIEILRQLSESDIASLMSLSEKLSALNHQRYIDWTQDHSLSPQCRQALLAFKGDVYQGLNAADWSKDDFTFAQDHLRILSGLYGILRPLDLMHAYRLEMGTKLPNPMGKNLYNFWGEQITEALNKEIAANKHQAVINLASNEYFKAVQPQKLDAPVIAPVFKDTKNGQLKIISFYAKKARGSMASWIIKNKIEVPSKLIKFSENGYTYCAKSSTSITPTFLRDLEA